MEYFLLAVSVSLGMTKSLLSKIVKRPDERAYKTFFSNAVMFTAAFVVVTLIGINSLRFISDVPTVLSLCYAVCTVGAQISLMQAVAIGPVSISTLFYSSGFLLPTIFGTLYYKENFHFLQGIGIALIIVSFILSVEKGNKEFSVKWLIVALLGLFFSGMVGVVQKVFVNKYSNVSLDIFLSLSFIFMVVFSVVICLFLFLKTQKSAEKEHREEFKKGEGKIFVLTLLLGVVIGLANKANTYLTGVLPSVLFFPISNGGTIFLTSVVSAVFLKEKLSARQKIAILVGMLAILCIGIGKSL